MALLRGKLLAGALFTGALFGVVQRAAQVATQRKGAFFVTQLNVVLIVRHDADKLSAVGYR